MLQNSSVCIEVFDDWDVKMDEFIPSGTEYLIQKSILVCIAPERDERVVFLVAWFFVAMVDHIIQIKSVEAFKKFSLRITANIQLHTLLFTIGSISEIFI